MTGFLDGALRADLASIRVFDLPFEHAISASVCVPSALSQGGGESLGAQAGPAALEEVVTSGGFTRFRIATRTPFNLVVEAKP